MRLAQNQLKVPPWGTKHCFKDECTLPFYDIMNYDFNLRDLVEILEI